MIYRRQLLTKPIGFFFLLIALILHFSFGESAFILFFEGIFFGLSIPLNIAFIYFNARDIRDSSL